MNIFYYLETSGLLKRYKTEPGSSFMADLFNAKQPNEGFITSQLTVLEVNAVAARMLKGGQLRQRTYNSLMSRFLRDLEQYNITVLPLDEHISNDALDLYPTYPLRAPDAIQFTTARRASVQLQPDFVYMVSGDKEIVGACEKYAFSVIDPESDDASAKLMLNRLALP